MLTHLRGHSLLGYIDGSIHEPTETVSATTDQGGRSQVVNPEYATWFVRDQTVLSGFFATVTEEILAAIMNVPIARAAWVILEGMFASRSRARVIQIRSQLTSAKKKGVSTADYFRNMKTLADTLAAIGQPLKEEEIISYVLAGLGPNYDALVTTLSVKDDLTLDEVYSHLLAYEHRQEVQDADYNIGNGNSANFANRNQGRGGGQGGHGGNPGGRGGGGRGSGGRGQGQVQNGGGGRGGGGRGGGGRGGVRGGGNTGNGALRPVCQICNKVGHIALCCYSRFDHAYGGEEEHHSANHATTSYQVEPNWYMDSDATDHITGDLEHLHVRDTYHGNDRVQVGNGAGLQITHTGHSTINTTAKNLVLKDVLHVPQISKDLLSIHKLAKDNGVFIEFHPYFFLIKDLVTERTLLRGRCRGGLYPIESSEISALKCAMFSSRVSREQWHHA